MIIIIIILNLIIIILRILDSFLVMFQGNMQISKISK